MYCNGLLVPERGRGSVSNALQCSLTFSFTEHMCVPSCWYISNFLSQWYSIVFRHPQKIFFTLFPQDPHSHKSSPLHLKSIVLTTPSISSLEQSGCSHINEPTQRPVSCAHWDPARNFYEEQTTVHQHIARCNLFLHTWHHTLCHHQYPKGLNLLVQGLLFGT